jgi:hypothetical protein
VVSLLNGLSALGQGVSTFATSAGLEQQKAALAQQQTILADSLATTRETTLQGQQQTFQSGENTLNRAAHTADIATEQSGASARNTATIAGDMARTQATINAPPETIKLLWALGVPLPGATPQTGGSASSGGTSGGTGQDYTGAPNPLLGGLPNPNESAPGATAGTSGASGGTSAPAPSTSGTVTGSPAAPVADPMDNPIVQKALGYPAAGSEDALRRSVAADVKRDPDFMYKTAGQQAIETENRVQVAKGAMTSPATQAANAAMIASYQIKPPDGFALSRPGAAETMAMVSKFNPEYQESRFPEINKAMSAFGSGKQGDIVRSLDVGVQHLDVIDQAASNLGNTNVAVVNSIKNAFQRQFGYTAPTTFEGLKQIVGTEVEKAVAGGIGTGADRTRITDALNSANSPAQLQAVTDGFRSLMAGQLAGLKTQYENDTGFKSGPFAFENKLGPATTKALGAHSGTTAASATATTDPDPLAAARDAIAQGAPPGAVAKRLRDNGIDPSRLLSGAQDLGRAPGQD